MFLKNRNISFKIKRMGGGGVGGTQKHKCMLMLMLMLIVSSSVFDNRYALSRTVEHRPPLPLYALIDSSFWFDTINLGWSSVYIEGSNVIMLKW